VNTILSAVLKLTDDDKKKANASMNLLGADIELTNKLNSALKVLRKTFTPEVLAKALKKISSMYNQKQTFINESLKYLYGPGGDSLVDWNIKIK
jgi:hypothetical protein